MTTPDGREEAGLLAIAELSWNSCRRTHKMSRHLRARVAAAGIVCLIHTVHAEQYDATAVPRDSDLRDVWRADANSSER